MPAGAGFTLSLREKMEVKDILDKIGQKEEKKECFFALTISYEKVKGAIWIIKKGETKVVSVGESKSWSEEEDLLDAVDKTLSSATEALTLEGAEEPDKVIFGLPEGWVKEEKIIPPKLEILKKISQKLDLKPVGFVVITEAIINQLKVNEGVPPTALLLCLNKSRAYLTLVSLGKIISSAAIKRSQDLGADVNEGLSRFGAEKSFPARLLLFDDKEDLEKAREELLAYSWPPSSFLHLPKVEILPSDFDIHAVALAGGREVAKAAGVKIFEPKPAIPKEEKEEAALPKEVEEAPGFGFIKGKDIIEEMPLRPELEIAEKPPESQEPEMPKEIPGEKIPAPPPPTKRLPAFKLPRIDWSSFPLPKIDFSKVAILFSPAQFRERTSLVIGAVLVSLFILGGLAVAGYWYFPRAQITLFVEPKVLEKEFEIKLDPQLSVPDPAGLALPAASVEAVVEGEKLVETTGTEIIGEPARGEVIIFNRTESLKKFPAETVIAGPGELKFLFDENVTVASESAGPDYTKIPGKATVSVTAVEIGTEGNLAGGSEFSIADFSTSDYIARNEGAFTGGTSREVRVVSEEDQKNLSSALTSELRQKAIQELSQRLPSELKLLEESLSDKVARKDFSQDVGAEADKLSLFLQLEFSALTYKEEEFKNLIENQIQGTIPAGFEFKKEESEINFELVKVEENGSAIFTATLRANLLPKLDLEEIKANIAGKYPEVGKFYLDNLPNVVDFEAEIRPRLPGKLQTFPRLAKNIQIEIRLK